MSRLFIIWIGAFLGAFAAEVVPQLFSSIPLGVIPGMLIFAAFSAFVPATLLIAGFACGYLLLRRRVIPTLLFIFAFVLAAVDIAAPFLLAKWALSSGGHHTIIAWMPLLGGFAISFMGSRSEADATRRPAQSRSESVRRRLAIAEGAVLVLPLLVLWPFSLVLFASEHYTRIPGLLIGLVLMAIAAAALVALLSLLKIFFDAGGPGLQLAAGSRWVLAAAGAGLVVLGGMVSVFGTARNVAGGLHAALGFGVLGVPALIPVLHMIIELRLSKQPSI